MPFVAWNETMRIGVDAVDDDHRAIFETLNTLLRLSSDKNAVDCNIGRVDSLLARARDHFRREETVMERIGFPDLDQHRTSHREFITQTTILRKVMDEESNSVLARVELIGFVAQWIHNHLRHQDFALRPYVASHQAFNGPLRIE